MEPPAKREPIRATISSGQKSRHAASRRSWLRHIAESLGRHALPQSNFGKACTSAIEKKNWLFIGYSDAGQRSAMIYSLVVSSQRHGKGSARVSARCAQAAASDDQPRRSHATHAGGLSTEVKRALSRSVKVMLTADPTLGRKYHRYVRTSCQRCHHFDSSRRRSGGRTPWAPRDVDTTHPVG